jgi:hypothetical protein
MAEPPGLDMACSVEPSLSERGAHAPAPDDVSATWESAVHPNYARNVTMRHIRHRMAAFLPDVVVEAILAKRRTEKWVFYLRPVTFNDHILHRKFYVRDALLTATTDKLAVREYVANRIGSEYLIPLLATAERAELFDWDSLPPPFVLKANHGSGMTIFVTDTRSMDREAVQAVANGWLATSYYEWRREWAYKHIRPMLLAEEFIGEHGREPPDYKFFVFGGRVQMIQVDTGRFSDHRRRLFTPDWRPIAVTYVYAWSDRSPPRPQQLPLMIELAESLAEPFPFARIDLYEVHGRVYFGEVTHYPEAGTGAFSPVEFDRLLGEVWKTGEPIPEMYIASGEGE